MIADLIVGIAYVMIGAVHLALVFAQHH